jgi:hypothetical protein
MEMKNSDWSNLHEYSTQNPPITMSSEREMHEKTMGVEKTVETISVPTSVERDAESASIGLAMENDLKRKETDSLLRDVDIKVASSDDLDGTENSSRKRSKVLVRGKKEIDPKNQPKYGLCEKCNQSEYPEIYLKVCPWCKKMSCCDCTDYCRCEDSLLCTECSEKNDRRCGKTACDMLAQISEDEKNESSDPESSDGTYSDNGSSDDNSSESDD